MTLLISSSEVVRHAFPDSMENTNAFVGDSVILAAEQKFIRPVLGKLYDRMLEGSYATFSDDYLKPALAHYVRYLLLPSIAAQVGTTGIIVPSGQNFDAASPRAVAALRRRAKADARALMLRAIEHVEANAADYPEYEPAKNAMRRTSTVGNVVL